MMMRERRWVRITIEGMVTLKVMRISVMLVLVTTVSRWRRVRREGIVVSLRDGGDATPSSTRRRCVRGRGPRIAELVLQRELRRRRHASLALEVEVTGGHHVLQQTHLGHRHRRTGRVLEGGHVRQVALVAGQDVRVHLHTRFLFMARQRERERDKQSALDNLRTGGSAGRST